MRNLTIQLDEDEIRDIKVVAAKRGTSVTALVALKMRELIAADARYETARQLARQSMVAAATSGRQAPRWTREEINER